MHMHVLLILHAHAHAHAFVYKRGHACPLTCLASPLPGLATAAACGAHVAGARGAPARCNRPVRYSGRSAGRGPSAQVVRVQHGRPPLVRRVVSELALRLSALGASQHGSGRSGWSMSGLRWTCAVKECASSQNERRVKSLEYRELWHVGNTPVPYGVACVFCVSQKFLYLVVGRSWGCVRCSSREDAQLHESRNS